MPALRRGNGLPSEAADETGVLGLLLKGFSPKQRMGDRRASSICLPNGQDSRCRGRAGLPVFAVQK